MNSTSPTPYEVLSRNPQFNLIIEFNNGRLTDAARGSIESLERFEIHNPDSTQASKEDTKMYGGLLKTLGWDVTHMVNSVLRITPPLC